MKPVDDVFKVVSNSEGQYSIWPADRDLPNGWQDEGTAGTKEECLQRVEQVWTDMRPISLRRRMEALAADQRSSARPDAEPEVTTMKPLSATLQESDHEFELLNRHGLKRCLEKSFMVVRIGGGTGATELGLKIDRWQQSQSGDSEFQLNGDLTLDFTKLSYEARVSPESTTGRIRFQSAAPSELTGSRIAS